MVERVQRQGRARPWCGMVLLAIWVLLGSTIPGQTDARLYQIGVLMSGPTLHPAFEAFREELAQRGHREGKHLRFRIEHTNGETEQLASRAAQLVAAAPDLIFTIGTTATTQARQATATLPIVFAFVADPIRSGLVASHSASRNNLTGISNHAGALSGKRLELLREILPGLKRILMFIAPYEQVSVMLFEEVAALAPKLGFELVRQDVTTGEEIEQALQTLARRSVDAIFYIPSSVVWNQMDHLIQKAREARLPLVTHEHSTVERGALLSYGADFRLLGRQAARLAIKIMHGAKPSEIPIQTPEKLSLAINLTTARTLGLKIPRSVLEHTDLLVE